MLWHTATGGTLSVTVTVAVQVEVLPLPSVTVSVTLFAPTFAQVKLVGVAAKVIGPQLSLLPPSTSDAVIVALPLASS